MGPVEMHPASLSPRGLAATVLAGLALLLLPASASAQEPVLVGDAPQSSTVSDSGRPDVDVGFVRTRQAQPQPRVRRARRAKARAARVRQREARPDRAHRASASRASRLSLSEACDFDHPYGGQSSTLSAGGRARRPRLVVTAADALVHRPAVQPDEAPRVDVAVEAEAEDAELPVLGVQRVRRARIADDGQRAAARADNELAHAAVVLLAVLVLEREPLVMVVMPREHDLGAGLVERPPDRGRARIAAVEAGAVARVVPEGDRAPVGLGGEVRAQPLLLL